MVDVQTVSIVIASASVAAGVVYYAFQIRHQNRVRQMDLAVRLYSVVTSKEFLEAWEKVRDRESLDYNTYMKKYGFAELNEVVGAMEEVGILLRRKLIDIDLADDLFSGTVKMIWEKLKPMVEEGRKLNNRPRTLRNIEYLYDEIQKREQRGVMNG